LGTYSKVQHDPTESRVGSLADDADIVIDTEHCTRSDVLVRTSSHLGLSSSASEQLVDIIIGGQYGSEGKGNIVSYLAPEYDILIRVGGPNAGHKVYGPDGVKFTHHQLPSGTLSAPRAQILIGPGAVLNMDKLLDEIAACKVDVERLKIDPQAMIISEADILEERKKGGLVQRIGSTGQGVGVATARRIRERHGNVLLAKDAQHLRPYISPTLEHLELAYARGMRVLLEGTQGTALSIYHGNYPHVTSRDTTASGTMSEAGIAPKRVRRVIMTSRTYPIRVADPKSGTSGPMSQPLSWAEIARRSGLNLSRLRKAERTSTTNRRRRVAEFDWALLQRAALLNGATDIALTFVDYIHADNQHARRFEQLTPATMRFVEEVERVSRAPVSLISTRFHPRCIIDRRQWQGGD
jgi:adenylosuccinate synthase